MYNYTTQVTEAQVTKAVQMFNELAGSYLPSKKVKQFTELKWYDKEKIVDAYMGARTDLDTPCKRKLTHAFNIVTLNAA